MQTLYYNAKIISGGTIADGALLVKDSLIVDILPATTNLPAADKTIDLKGNYLAPGFVDGHIHGTGGHGTDKQNEQDLLALSATLKRYGVAAFLPTIYPGKLDTMLATLAALAPAIGREQGAKIPGFHIEGPFLSPQRLGVMRTDDLIPIAVTTMQKLYDAAQGKITAMTVAPELPDIEELAAFCKAHNILLQAGHTDATFDEMLRAQQYGINHITHLFNAMRGLNHREPGAAGAALIEDKFTCEVIADGRHIHPAIVAMLMKLKKPSQIMLVTDALQPTGANSGVANGEEVELKDGLFKRKQDGVIAGSALTMLGGVKNLISWGYPIANAFLAACDNPANLYKLNCGTLQKGKEARLISLDDTLKLTGIYF